jgi:hypothetical protein
MGFFKDMKNMVNNANSMVGNAQQMQANAMAAQQAANAPVDPNDPIFAPIEDISVDKYAEISAGLMKKGIMGLENVNAYVESMGVKAGTWPTVQNGWVQRMGANMAVRTRYGNLYNEYLK